jgi:putative endonuclease
MYYLYALKSDKDRKMYIGATKDLKQRIRMHNTGKIKSTKLRKPLKLVYYEAFSDKSDAFAREQWLKSGWGRNQVHNMLRNALKV